MATIKGMTIDPTSEAIAACWGNVTELEQVFGSLRDQFGLVPAVRALTSFLMMKDKTWATERLAAAVAALDDVRRQD